MRGTERISYRVMVVVVEVVVAPRSRAVGVDPSAVPPSFYMTTRARPGHRCDEGGAPP